MRLLARKHNVPLVLSLTFLVATNERSGGKKEKNSSIFVFVFAYMYNITYAENLVKGGFSLCQDRSISVEMRGSG